MSMAINKAGGPYSPAATEEIELLDVECHDDLLRAKDINSRREQRHVEAAIRVPPPQCSAELRQAPCSPICTDTCHRQPTIPDEHGGLLPRGGDAEIDLLRGDATNFAQEGLRLSVPVESMVNLHRSAARTELWKGEENMVSRVVEEIEIFDKILLRRVLIGTDLGC